MHHLQIFITLIFVGVAFASNYGNSFNYGNSYPYSGKYVGAKTGNQYNAGYSGYAGGYKGYSKSYTGYGPSVYNNVILPAPYPYPVPTRSGSDLLLLNGGGNRDNGILGFGQGGIFGLVIMFVVFQYILQLFNQNQNQG